MCLLTHLISSLILRNQSTNSPDKIPVFNEDPNESDDPSESDQSNNDEEVGPLLIYVDGFVILHTVVGLAFDVVSDDDVGADRGGEGENNDDEINDVVPRPFAEEHLWCERNDS